MDVIPTPNLPEVDVTNSEQNAFVQNWLTASIQARGDDETLESAIEAIQETYNYQDHYGRL